jgi:integrase
MLFSMMSRPYYWPDAALKRQVRPAALRAGINKHIGWHTFRHSIGTLLNASGESIKTIQELLRHANSRVTLEFYVQGDVEAKRKALKNVSGIFVVPPLKRAG